MPRVPFSFFLWDNPVMIDDLTPSLLTGAEEELKRRFNKEEADKQRLPSDAAAASGSDRVGQLTLPDDQRKKMPFTKDKYLVRENPHLVGWEREVRKFLRNLSPDHSHRVSATMVYEWATGIRLEELRALEKEQGVKQGRVGTWRADMRKINQCLEYYFGKPYMTYIVGRKVPKAYRVRPGYYIKRHRPMTLELYSEYLEGTLNP